MYCVFDNKYNIYSKDRLIEMKNALETLRDPLLCHRRMSAFSINFAVAMNEKDSRRYGESRN